MLKILGKYNFLLFIPLLIYIGERSPIATDEGYYILQSRWILNSGDWISPTYWGTLALDRTIAMQAIIAFSQKIFGENMFSKRLIETVKPFSGMILPDEANNLTLSKVYSPAYCIPLAIR